MITSSPCWPSWACTRCSGASRFSPASPPGSEPPTTGVSCSGCLAIPCRRWSRSRCSSPRRWLDSRAYVPCAAWGATAVLGVDLRRNPRREQAIRVRLERGDGPPVATPNGAQGSHILTSLVGADALAMIPRRRGHPALGDRRLPSSPSRADRPAAAAPSGHNLVRCSPRSLLLVALGGGRRHTHGAGCAGCPRGP